MNKPLSIIIEELNSKIIKAVNESGLPPIILQYIVGNIMTEIGRQSDAQHEKDVIEYQQYLEQTENN